MTGADLITVQDQGQSVKGIGGGKQVSDLISKNVSVQWSGTAGTVTGDILKVTGWKEFDPTDSDGYFFPVSLDQRYSGKQITCTGSKSYVAEDLDWVLKVDNCKNFTFQCDGEPEITLDFNKATLKQE